VRPPARNPPPTDEEWDRRSLEGTDPESGVDRHKLRKLADRAESIEAMVERYERWAVFRSITMRFAIATGALVAALSAFRSDIMSLIEYLRGGP